MVLVDASQERVGLILEVTECFGSARQLSLGELHTAASHSGLPVQRVDARAVGMSKRHVHVQDQQLTSRTDLAVHHSACTGNRWQPGTCTASSKRTLPSRAEVGALESAPKTTS
jgi:hypothetical protein